LRGECILRSIINSAFMRNPRRTARTDERFAVAAVKTAAYKSKQIMRPKSTFSLYRSKLAFAFHVKSYRPRTLPENVNAVQTTLMPDEIGLFSSPPCCSGREMTGVGRGVINVS